VKAKRAYKPLEGSFPAATEALAIRFHAVYQEEARRQAELGADELRYPDNYDDLPEHTKDYDRALAMFVLEQLLSSNEAQRLEHTVRMLIPAPE
jgi:hypothetical protein